MRIKREIFLTQLKVQCSQECRQKASNAFRAEGAQRDAEIRANVDGQVTVLIQTAQGTDEKIKN